MAKTKTPRKVDSTNTESVESALTSRSKVLVFISHDSRDASLAEAFENLLADVSAGTLKSFRSSDKKGTSGIEFGAEWYKSIMLQLNDATDVVALLTPRSLDRPWILYETGVAKGKLETTVFGLALGVPLPRVSTGPFGQFQNCGDDEESLTKLVMQLLKRNPDAAPREEAVLTQVRVFREKIQQLLDIEKKEVAPVAPLSGATDAAKLFEEVKAMVRDLPERLDARIIGRGHHRSVRRRRQIPLPILFQELVARSSSQSGPNGVGIALQLSLSIYRDTVPWLYDLGIELIKVLNSGNREAIGKAAAQFINIVELSVDLPLLEDIEEEAEFRGDIRHFLHVLQSMLGRWYGLPRRRRRAATAAPSGEEEGGATILGT